MWVWSDRVRGEDVGVVRQGEGEGVVKLRRWREHVRDVGRCDCQVVDSAKGAVLQTTL